MTPVRLEPVAPRSRVKHSTTEPLRFRINMWVKLKTGHKHYIRARKSKDPDVKIHYKRFSAHVQKVLRDAYWKHISNIFMFENDSSDPDTHKPEKMKKFWLFIKSRK